MRALVLVGVSILVGLGYGRSQSAPAAPQAAAPTAASAAVKALSGTSLDIPTSVPVQYVWQAMGVGADGTIYVGGCINPRRKASANLTAIDPKTLKLRELVPGMDKALKIATTLPTFKIHTPLVAGPDGRMYGATHTELLKDAPSKWEEYAGGHFFACDPKTGQVQDFGLGLIHKGIVAIAIDFPRGKLYGLCYPRSVLVETDMKTGRSIEHGRFGTTNINRNLRLLRGKLYTAEQYDGSIMEFDPATSKIQPTKWSLPHEPDWKPGQGVLGFWASVVDGSGNWLVGVTTAGNRLFKFDPAGGVTDLGRVGPSPRRGCESMDLSPDRKWLYCFHNQDAGAGVPAGVARFTWPECTPAGRVSIHDAADPARVVTKVTAGVCGRDGRLYLAVKYDRPPGKTGNTEILVLDGANWPG